MIRRTLLLALLLTGCGLRAPIRNTIAIEPDEKGRNATITVVTEFSTMPASRAVSERLRAARLATLDGRDEWSPRFGSVTALSERIAFDKERGVLKSAQRTAVIDIDDLQRFFTDTGITVQITRGEGWTELSYFPGSATRASRLQRDRVALALKTWTADAQRYLRAMNHLYSYLDREPHRAEVAFEAIFSDDEEQLAKEEVSLVGEVKRAMDSILEHMKLDESEATTLDEEFDLVYNPFPGEIIVKLPRPVIAAEGFTRRDGDSVAIRRSGILDAAAALDGRWLAPDPMAMMLKTEEAQKELPDAATLARMPRKRTATPSRSEIEDAFVEQLRPAATYRVRW